MSYWKRFNSNTNLTYKKNFDHLILIIDNHCFVSKRLRQHQRRQTEHSLDLCRVFIGEKIFHAVIVLAKERDDAARVSEDGGLDRSPHLAIVPHVEVAAGGGVRLEAAALNVVERRKESGNR